MSRLELASEVDVGVDGALSSPNARSPTFLWYLVASRAFPAEQRAREGVVSTGAGPPRTAPMKEMANVGSDPRA